MKYTKTDYLGNIDWYDWDGETWKSFKDHVNGLDYMDEAILDHEYGSSGVSIKWKREETDEEYNKRLEKEEYNREKLKSEQLEREKLEYLRLRAKFENK